MKPLSKCTVQTFIPVEYEPPQMKHFTNIYYTIKTQGEEEHFTDFNTIYRYTD